MKWNANPLWFILGGQTDVASQVAKKGWELNSWIFGKILERFRLSDLSGISYRVYQFLFLCPLLVFQKWWDGNFLIGVGLRSILMVGSILYQLSLWAVLLSENFLERVLAMGYAKFLSSSVAEADLCGVWEGLSCLQGISLFVVFKLKVIHRRLLWSCRRLLWD